MMKGTILLATKNCGRRLSTMASSSSSVKHGSAKPEGGGWALYGAFLAGYIVSLCKNNYLRGVHRKKVHELYDENIKRSGELNARFQKYYWTKAMKELTRESRKDVVGESSS